MCRYLPLLLCILSVNLHASECQSIRVNGADGWEPISHRNSQGQLSVLAVEVANKVFSQLKIELKYGAKLPWKRQLHGLEMGSLDMIVAAYFNAERVNKFDYSDPYHIESIRIFVRSDRTFNFQSLDSLKGKVGLRPLGGTYGSHFDKFAADNLNIKEYSHIESSMKRIHKGRGDYLVLALFDGLLSAKKYGYAHEIIPLAKNAAKLPIHFLMSKKTPCKNLIKKINPILAELKSMHFIKNLEKKHLRQLD